MEILIGRDYASADRFWAGHLDPDSVKQVRVLEIRGDRVIVKRFPKWPTSTRGRNVSEKIRREITKGFGFDPYLDPGARGEVSLDSLFCFWEDWPALAPEVRKVQADRRAQAFTGWRGMGRKYKCRKGRYLKGGVYDESTKENRTISNRRDRHKNKIQIHTNMKKHG